MKIKRNENDEIKIGIGRNFLRDEWILIEKLINGLVKLMMNVNIIGLRDNECKES